MGSTAFGIYLMEDMLRNQVIKFIVHINTYDFIYFSAISGKELAEDCDAMGYKNLPIYNEHISCIETLVFDDEGKNIEHHDPFDRILIAQAKAYLKQYGKQLV